MVPNEMKPKSKNSSERERPIGFSWNIGYILLAVAGVYLINDYVQRQVHPKAIPYSEFLRELQNGQVGSVTLSDSTLIGELKSAKDSEAPSTFVTVPFEDPALVQKLEGKGVTFRREISSSFFTTIVSWVAPLLLFYLLWSFILRRASGGMQGGLLSLTKSKAKVFMEKDVKTTFADVAGVDEAKDELCEVVNFLKEPQRYARLGGRIPKGVLLVGPPGTGKTLLARAIAGEANVPFFSINGSEFVEMFVGLGAARVRDLFEQTKKNAPCILFIDEIDALGKSRALGLGSLGADDEKEQTLNQLLAEMDGFNPQEGVILLAATNRPEILDPALLRAGRFDRQVLIGLPDQAGRAQILSVHLKKIKVDPSLDVARVAALTPGFSGADLANAVNEAALVATRRGAESVTELDFTQAIERIVAGLEQKRLMNPAEKKRVAYHEMGHAAVALALGTTEKVHKVSIIPRGIGSLGYTLRRPTEDRYLLDEDEIMAKIAVLLGGRGVEKMILGKVSTGAADDLAKATDLARSMVINYGMSERLGLAVYDVARPKFLGPFPMSEGTREISEATSRMIDTEVRRVLNSAYAMAIKVIKDHLAFVHAGAERLLAIETLDETDLMTLWRAEGPAFPPPPAPLSLVTVEGPTNSKNSNSREDRVDVAQSSPRLNP